MRTPLASLRKKTTTGLAMVLAVVGLVPAAMLAAPASAQDAGRDVAASSAVTAPTSFGTSAEPVPEGARPAASADYSPDQDVLAYWTPERMAAAKPYEPEGTTSQAGSGQAQPGDRRGQGADPVASPSRQQASPASGSSSSSTDPEATTDPVAPQDTGRGVPETRINGKLFFNGYGVDSAYCSASVVSTPTQRVVITAGHCVYDQASGGWMKDVVFVPDYDLTSDDPDPAGIWTARSLRAFDSWITSNTTYTSDVGFVTLNDGGDFNQPVAQAVGGYGLAWSGSYEYQATVFGYPSNVLLPSGRYSMYVCQDSAVRSAPSNYPDQVMSSADGCDFGPGASGGPWVFRYDPGTELGYVRNVTSLWLPRTGQNWAPYFTQDVKTMMDETVWD